MTKPLTAALQKLPQQDILALATSLHAIGRAQIAAGYRPTAREAQIMEHAAKTLSPTNRKLP